MNESSAFAYIVAEMFSANNILYSKPLGFLKDTIHILQFQDLRNNPTCPFFTFNSKLIPNNHALLHTVFV